MKNLLAALLMCIAATALASEKKGVLYDVVLTRVVDGDTVAFQAPWLPDPLKKELSLRVFGVDTPEKGHRAVLKKHNEVKWPQHLLNSKLRRLNVDKLF